MNHLGREIMDNAYTNITDEDVENLSLEDLHNRLSRLLNLLERNEEGKKVSASAYGSLIKKIKADIRTINKAIRGRSKGEVFWNAVSVETIRDDQDESWDAAAGKTGQPKLDSGLSA